MDDMTQERYLSKQCIRLGELEKAYGRPELAEQIVRQHVRTVYGMSGSRYQPDEQMVAMTAGRFVAKYGRTCTLYDMMVFFANFGSDFRTTWSTFDYNDIIKGFKERFEPWADQTWMGASSAGATDNLQRQYRQESSARIRPQESRQPRWRPARNRCFLQAERHVSGREAHQRGRSEALQGIRDPR